MNKILSFNPPPHQKMIITHFGSWGGGGRLDGIRSSEQYLLFQNAHILMKGHFLHFSRLL